MIGLFFRYVFSIPKLNRKPEQHELAQLFIDYADGRVAPQAILDFLEPRRWPRDVRELRITHALSLIKVHRRDVYDRASELGRLIMREARQGTKKAKMANLSVDQMEAISKEVFDLMQSRGVNTNRKMIEILMIMVFIMIKQMPVPNEKEQMKKSLISTLEQC